MHILSSVIPGQPGQVKECEAIFLWPVTAISGQAYWEGSDMSAIKVFCQSYSVVCLSVCLFGCLLARQFVRLHQFVHPSVCFSA